MNSPGATGVVAGKTTTNGTSKTSVFVQQEGVSLREAGSFLLLVGPDGRPLATVNDSAALVWSLTDGRRSIQAIAELAAEALNESGARIVSDVLQGLEALASANLVRLIPDDPPDRGEPVSGSENAFVSGVDRSSVAKPYAEGGIEREVRFRMGGFFEHAVQPAGRNAPDSLPPYVTILDFDGGELATSVDPARHRREVGFVHTVSTLLPSDAVCRMAICGEDGFEGSNDVAAFSFCRPRNSRNSILWPLVGYTTIDSAAFGKDVHRHDRPWTEKRSTAVWRGASTGIDLKGKSMAEIDKLSRAPHNRYDHIDDRSFIQANRLQLVQNFCHDGQVDVGFSDLVQMDDTAKERLSAMGYAKPRMSQSELLSYRYLIVVDGNSFATQLPWSLNSNSVVIMPTPAWETIVHGYEPWEHYVPLAFDFSDLLEKLEWCRSHEARCREISEAARAFMARYYDEHFENLVRKDVLDRYLRGGS